MQESGTYFKCNWRPLEGFKWPGIDPDALTLADMQRLDGRQHGQKQEPSTEVEELAWGGDGDSCIGLISDAERTCQKVDVENEEDKKSECNPEVPCTIENKQNHEMSKKYFP